MQNGIKKPKKQKKQTIFARALVLVLVFSLLAVGLGARLYQLQIKESSEWLVRASKQQLANIPIEPVRGSIYDSEMKLLAQSAVVWTIEGAPDVMAKSYLKGNLKSEKDIAKAAAKELALVLEMSEEEQTKLYERLSKTDKKWCMIKEKVEKPMADAVQAICKEYGIKGVYLTKDSKRYYPYGDLGSTILGFVTDNEGREGLEYYMNESLTGVAGRRVTGVDAQGRIMAGGDNDVSYPANDGESLVLTVNAEIQQSLDKNLMNAVIEHSAAERGMGIVMNVKTGEILGLSVYPAYNSNDPYYIFNELERNDLEYIYDADLYAKAQGEMRSRQWRNKAIVDTYEPGSVFKIITAAAAIDSGEYNMDSHFACGGSMVVVPNEPAMRCAASAVHGNIPLSEALIESCNVSFIKMAQGMGAETWYDYVKAFGLTEQTGVDMPGEPSQASFSNVIYSPTQMGPIELASCSFGQSNKYTALQMITAVSAAVNGGNLMQPYIVKQRLDANGNVTQNNEPIVKRQVISEETSIALRGVLEELVARPKGLGNRAYVAGYHVGGKSGTSQKLEKLQINPDEPVYIASFLGIAPSTNPEIAVLIALDEPEDPAGRYFGGRLAGPTVGYVINDVMKILGVEPDYSEEDLARTTQGCPDVVNKSLGDAQTQLSGAGLTYFVVGGGAEVVGQYPVAYTQVPGRGQIVLYTDPADPLQVVKMPILSGRSATNAIKTLKEIGLNVVTKGALENTAGAVVMEQSEEAGIEVPRGAVITITLDNPNAQEAH